MSDVERTKVPCTKCRGKGCVDADPTGPLSESEIEDYFTGDDPCWDADDTSVTRRVWDMYDSVLAEQSRLLSALREIAAPKEPYCNEPATVAIWYVRELAEERDALKVELGRYAEQVAELFRATDHLTEKCNWLLTENARVAKQSAQNRANHDAAIAMLEHERLQHDETRGYRQRAEQERDRLWALLEKNGATK